jgi:hypothetical protein
MSIYALARYISELAIAIETAVFIRNQRLKQIEKRRSISGFLELGKRELASQIIGFQPNLENKPHKLQSVSASTFVKTSVYKYTRGNENLLWLLSDEFLDELYQIIEHIRIERRNMH